MQKLKKFKGSKLVKVLLITVLLVSLLVVAVLAEDYTVTTGKISGYVGDNVELWVSFTNNTDETVNGMLMRVILPTSYLALVDDSVRINDGQWNQATYAAASTVRSSLEYRYNYDSATGALLVSLGNIAPGKTVTIALTVNITSMNSNSFMYNFYKDNDTSDRIKGSSVVEVVPIMAEVKPVIEKTSRNLTSSGDKANVGDVIEYTVKATNATSMSQSLWTNVTVTDALPDGVSFVNGSVTIDGSAASASQYSYNVNTKTLTVYLSDLGSNASSTVTFCASIDEGAYGKTISNSVTVSGNDREDNNQTKTGEATDGDGHKVNNVYTITFDKNADDAQGTMDPQTIVENSPTQLNQCNFTRTGYIFVGWSTDKDAKVQTYNDRDEITPTGDMTLYAVWTTDACTITFDKNADDAIGTMDPQAAARNLAVTLKANAFTRTGYSFAGWSADKDAKVPTYNDRAEITPTGDMTTLYAVWTQSTCTITFDKNANDAAGTMDPQVVDINVAATLKANAFTRSDYYFRGWSTSPNGEIAYSDGGSITLAESTTLYAVWGADPCTITFHKNADSATGTMDPQVVDPNVPVALNANQFERSGYYFDGWSTDPNATVAEYANKEVITPVDDMDLYVVWHEIVLTDDHIAYINGYPEGDVRPDSNISRAEAVTIFYRLIVDDQKGNTVSGTFTDVESDKWYTQAVNYMAKISVVNGYTDGSFRPDQPITRAEFAKIAARFAVLGYPEGDAFSDVTSSHWAYLYINSAYEKGWVNGYDDGKFYPERNITRAEVMSIVNKMLERKIDDAALAQITNPYTDIATSHWAYKDVIEASIAHEYVRDDNRTETWTSW